MIAQLPKERFEALEQAFHECPGDCDACSKTVTCERTWATLDRLRSSRGAVVVTKWFRENMVLLFGVYL